MWLGGGNPRALSFIVSEEELIFWGSFGIEKGSGAKFQSENLCVVYENEDWIIFALEDRILQLKKDFIKGFGSIPSPEKKDYENTNCRSYLITNILKLRRVN